MPVIDLTTNVRVADPKTFSLELSKFAAEALKRPASYMSVKYTYNEYLTFGGSFDPALILAVTLLDNTEPRVNEAYSKAFFAFFKETLGVPDDRGYIAFHNAERANIGHRSTTMEVHLGGRSIYDLE